MDKKIRVSVVIPVYNEREGLSGVVRDLEKALRGVIHEVIVVDDGSEDGSDRVAASLRGVRVLRHPYNRGYGAALKTGIRSAKYERILIIDADGTYPADAVPGLLRAADRYDMAVGARRTGGFLRSVPKWFLRRLAQFLSGRPIPDLNSGLRVFRRDAALDFIGILPSAFSFTTTITLAFLCNDLTVGYVPIDYRARTGTSKIRPVRDTLNFLALVVRAVMYFNPLKVFLTLTAILFAAGTVEAVYFLATSWSISKSTVLILLSSLLTALLGLLADLIIKRMPLLRKDGR